MKTKYLIVLFIAISLFYFCHYFFATDNFIYAEKKDNNEEKLSSVKNKINNNFKNIKSFIADLNIKKYDGEVITGKIFYKSTPYVRTKMIWLLPDGEVINYTDNLEIIYMPSKNIAIKKMKSTDSFSNAPHILQANDYLDKAKTYEDNKFYYYELPLPMPSPQLMTDEIPVKMKGSINKLYGYTEKIVFINSKEKEIETQEFRNYQLNIPIEDKEFEFVPPKDCQIMFQTEVSH